MIVDAQFVYVKSLEKKIFQSNGVEWNKFGVGFVF